MITALASSSVRSFFARTASIVGGSALALAVAATPASAAPAVPGLKVTPARGGPARNADVATLEEVSFLIGRQHHGRDLAPMASASMNQPTLDRSHGRR